LPHDQQSLVNSGPVFENQADSLGEQAVCEEHAEFGNLPVARNVNIAELGQPNDAGGAIQLGKKTKNKNTTGVSEKELRRRKAESKSAREVNAFASYSGYQAKNMTSNQKKVAAEGIGDGSSKPGKGSKMNSKTANILKKKNKK